MKVGILVAGYPPGELAERFGGYDAMSARLLGPDFACTPYEVQTGALPEPEAEQAWLVTGSPAGVYDPLEWIPRLEDFLCRSKGKAKLVGICFGHQVMAEAFGGRVEKSARGWGVGLQTYDVRERAWFMDEAERIAIPVSHQDQIVVQPPSTRILAASDFSPFGMLLYGDQPALSMQFHPEFEPDFTRALIETRRDRLPDAGAAIASLAAPDDRARVAGWIRRFLLG